jgi:hypothetical protein
MSPPGPTRTSRDVRFRAAIRGITDIKRADPTASIYEYTPQTTPTLRTSM